MFTVPVVVAVMVWVIRVLIIGTFSLAGESLFTVGEGGEMSSRMLRRQPPASFPSPAHRPVPAVQPLATAAGVEPSYHPAGMSARAHQQRPSLRQ